MELWLLRSMAFQPGCPMGRLCAGVGVKRRISLTNGSQAGAEKPTDRKPLAHLGNQITRTAGGNLGEGK